MKIPILALALLLSGCSTATSRARVHPSDIVVELVQFHGAVAEQYQQGGMELEHFLVVTAWIGDEIRILQTNPRQWEGQARLDWPRVRSIITPFEHLAPWAAKIDGLLQ